MIGRGHGVYRRDGLAMVAVIWVIVVAGLLLLGFNKMVRVNLHVSHNAVESVRARWLARAGVAAGLAALEQDDPAWDGNWDPWYDHSELLGPVELAGGTFTVYAPPDEAADPSQPRSGLVDHSGLLNLNTASEEQLAALCDLAPWQVDSILDWRDPDQRARSSGAEGPFYDTLPLAYLIRNGAFLTVGELRLVREIDDLAYFGEDANLNGLLDPNENDLSARLPDDDGDSRLRRGLAGLTTVWSYEQNLDAGGRPRVNINTVDKQTLTDRFNLTDGLAEAVVSHKSSGGSQGNDGQASQRFGKIMDLLEVKAKSSSREDQDADRDKVNEITLNWVAEHLDELTLTDEKTLPGRVNVNTAPAEVLLTLPKFDEAAVAKILQRRATGEGPFQKVAELLETVLSEEQFQAAAEQLSVRGSVFEIRSRGVTDLGIRHDIVAVVDRGQGMRILYWHQSE